MRRTAALASISACAAGVLVAALFVQCGSNDDAPPEDEIKLPERMNGVDSGGLSDASLADAPVDASVPACDTKKPFGTPVRLVELDAAGDRSTPRLSADELTIYFTTHGDASLSDLSMAVRASKRAPFGNEKVLPQSTQVNDNDPSVGADDLTLWFHSKRAASADIYLATRTSPDASFGDAAPISNVNQDTTSENQPYFRSTANELWFISDRPAADGGFDIYTAARTGAVFGAPSRIAELSSPANDWQPQPSEDGLTVVFASDRPGGKGGFDLWIARRASSSAKFSAPTPITELNSANDEQAGWLSADGCRIWFSSGRETADDHQQIFHAERPK